MANMTKQMAIMNANLARMQKNIRDTVSEAIEPISARIDANTKRMDRIENRQRNEIEEIKYQLGHMGKCSSKGQERGGSYAAAAATP